MYRTIEINGKAFEVRINLHDFLTTYRARPSSSSTWLWIDQLCIDQSNLTERGRQVLLMARIYPSAGETFIWLGLDPRLDVACRKSVTVGEAVKAAGEVDDDEAERVAMRSLQDDEISNIKVLCQHPYWKRHWIIQEIVLSRNCTLLRPQVEIAWRDFILLAYFRDFDRGLAMLINASIMAEGENDVERWFFCMSLAEQTSCEDVRDKVYGMQSIFGGSARILVDYTVTPSMVFLRALCAYEGASFVAREREDTSYLADAAHLLAGAMSLCDKGSRYNLYVAVLGYVQEAGPNFEHRDEQKFRQLIEKHVAAWEESSGASRDV